MSCKKPLLLSLVSFFLFGCSGETGIPTKPGTDGRGALALRISIDPASPFKKIAKTGDLTVSGSDMATLTTALTIGDSTVEAKLSGIPAGAGRLIQLKVYDSAGTVRYKGSATADIAADSTSAVPVVLNRITGTLVVNGTVSESDSGSDTAHTVFGSNTTVAVGAQAAVVGSVLDVDTKMAWTAAVANSNQGGIDLVFLYYGGSLHLDNAVAAKAAGVANNLNLTSGFSDAQIKDVKMVKVNANPADQESAKRMFTSGVKIKGSVISGGEMFIVESTEGKLAIVRVATMAGSGSSTNANLEVILLTIP